MVRITYFKERMEMWKKSLITKKKERSLYFAYRKAAKEYGNRPLHSHNQEEFSRMRDAFQAWREYVNKKPLVEVKK